MKTITKKTAKNGATLYYIDGKRASRADAMYWQRQNEIERKYLARIEAEKTFLDAMSEVNTSADAIDAAVEAEIEKQTPEYIFTAYQIVTGVDCNARTERVESFATTCKELGDDDNFTGLYRAVTFYEDWHYNAWDIKTADGKLIAKGNTEAELKKAYEAIKAGNVEVSEEIAEDDAAVEAESEIVNPCRFMVHVKYFSYEKGFIGHGGELEEFATATAAAKWLLAWTANRPFDTVTKDTVIYDFDNYAEEYRLTDADLNILNNRHAELDGSEEDIDGDNVFDYLPALDEFNDVDIDGADDDNNNDTQSAAEDFVEEYIFIDAAPVNHIVKVKCTCTIINGEELLTQAGTPRIVRSDKYGAEIQFMTNGDIAYYTFDDKNFDRQAEADFFAIMADCGACTIDNDLTEAEEIAAG